MKVSNIIISLIFLFSCSAEKQAQREEKKIAKATQYLLSKDKLDDVCAENYPVKDSIIKGDSVIFYDTIFEPGSTIIDTVVTKDTVRITITKTLPAKTIVKAIYSIDTIVRENTAAINACEDDKRTLIGLLNKKTTESDDWKGKAKKRFWIMWVLIVLLVAIIGLNIYKAFKPLKSKI